MEPNTLSQNSELRKDSITHIIVEEVSNSQHSHNAEAGYNPFLTQSQQLSQPGPSNQPSWPEAEFPTESNSLPRKRGRPTRSSYLYLKPTRESKRERKCPTVLNYETFKERITKHTEWTKRDRTLLLAGCLEVGVEDIDGLKQFLPHMSENDIKNEITSWKELAHRKLEKSLFAEESVGGVDPDVIKNLEDWIHYFKEKAKSSDASTAVMSNYFAILAEYGELPTPEESGGIDARAMYRCIHCMMNGLPPYGLNKTNAKALLICLENVLDKLNNPDLVTSLEDHLFNRPITPENDKYKRKYSRKARHDASVKPLDQILCNPIMNPLNLSENAMLKMVEESKEESDED